MRWLFIIAIVLPLAQQPTEPPKDRPPESNRAKDTGHAKGTDQKQDQSAASLPAAAQPPLGAKSNTSSQTESGDTDTHKQQANKEDLSIQQKLALFTGALVVVGILQTVVMFVTWLIYRRQAHEMRRQRHEMRRQRYVMLRQWRAMRAQLGQMESSARQTDKIIEQATKQVTAVEGQAELMKTAGTHTEQLAEQAVRQTALTQSQLELSNRPWISIDAVVPATNMVFDERGCVIMLATQLRNVGSSVAKHVSIFIDVIVGGVHNPVEVKEKVVAILKKPVDSSFDHGKLIFPNQIVPDQYPIIIRPDVVKKALEEGHFKDSKQITFQLFVCADYQSTFDPTRHHQTQGIYNVGRIDRQRGVLMGTFSPSQTSYDIKDIVINYTGYGAYAD